MHGAALGTSDDIHLPAQGGTEVDAIDRPARAGGGGSRRKRRSRKGQSKTSSSSATATQSTLVSSARGDSSGPESCCVGLSWAVAHAASASVALRYLLWKTLAPAVDYAVPTLKSSHPAYDFDSFAVTDLAQSLLLSC